MESAPRPRVIPLISFYRYTTTSAAVLMLMFVWSPLDAGPAQGSPEPQFLQIGAFRVPRHAEALSRELKEAGFKTRIVTRNELVRVLVGPFCEPEVMEAARDDLVAKNYPSIVQSGRRSESDARATCAEDPPVPMLPELPKTLFPSKVKKR